MAIREEHIRAIEEALNQGRIFEAHNQASLLRYEDPRHLRLHQLLALSLARLNQPDEGLKIIGKFYEEGHRDEETTGILARIYKDLYGKSGDPAFLDRSISLYEEGFRHTGSYYPAINAATLHLIAGAPEKSKKLAAKVRQQISDPDNYWELATLGEACVLTGDFEQAIAHYRKAIQGAHGQFGKIRSSRNQLKLLSAYLDIPDDIFQLFPQPTIAFLTGHMIDSEDRAKPRFPNHLAPDIKAKIRKTLEAHDVDIGFVSAACGSDVLFIESLQELGKEVRIFLPFCEEDFIRTSVAFAGEQWVKRFKSVTGGTDVHYVTNGPYYGDPEIYRYLARIMMGECLLMAELYDVKPFAISVLTGVGPSKTGGTRDVMGHWPFVDRWINIDPAPESDSLTPSVPVPPSLRSSAVPAENYRISHILFADITGFSRIPEPLVPRFMEYVFDQASRRLETKKIEPEVFNTWGDAILLTHSDPQTLMEMALIIQSIFRDRDWNLPDLPEHVDVRIALHAGPVFYTIDALTQRPNVFGESVNRAARMEPVTVPGAIYASGHFACLLKVLTGDKYSFQHVGIIKLPKNFGTQEIYEVAGL